MPFSIRPSRRFPVCCPVTYQCGDFEGHGTVWNLSLTVNLPSESPIYVMAAMVWWAQQGEEYGVETLVIDEESQEDLERYICQQVSDRWVEIHTRRTARPRKHEVDRDF